MKKVLILFVVLINLICSSTCVKAEETFNNGTIDKETVIQSNDDNFDFSENKTEIATDKSIPENSDANKNDSLKIDSNLLDEVENGEIVVDSNINEENDEEELKVQTDLLDNGSFNTLNSNSFSFYFDSETGLQITSSSLNAYSDIEYISLKKDDEYFYLYNATYDSNNSFVFSMQYINDRRLLSGEYEIKKLYVDDSQVSFTDTYINIYTNCISCPSDISIQYISGTGLIINSSDKNYLKKIEYISIQQYDYDTYEYFSDDSIVYDSSLKYTYIPDKYIKSSDLLTGSVSWVNIGTSDTYTSYSTDSDIYLYTNTKNAPSDINIIYCENDYLAIDSQDKDYLSEINGVNIYYELGNTEKGIYLSVEDSGYYDNSLKMIIFNQDTLNNFMEEDNTIKSVYIYADGYLRASIGDLSIDVSIDPVTYNFEYVDNLGLKITSNNNDILEQIEYIGLYDSNNRNYQYFDVSYTSGQNYALIKQEKFNSGYINSGTYTVDCIAINGVYRDISNKQVTIKTYADEFSGNVSIEFNSTLGLIIDFNDVDYVNSITSIKINDEYPNDEKESDRVIVSIDDLVSNNISNINKITVKSNGYYYKYYYVSIDVVDGRQTLSDNISFSIDENSNFIIKSTNKDFLRNIESVKLTIDDRTMTFNPYYDENNKYACIGANEIIYSISSGEHNCVIVLNSTGYKTITKNDILYFETNLNKAPNDVSFSYEEGTGIIINSADKNYLKSINYIHLSSNNCGEGFFDSDYDVINKYAYISQEEIDNQLLDNGVYNYVDIWANNYDTFNIDDAAIVYNQVLNDYPNDINIYLNDDEIIVESQDKTYLSKLCHISIQLDSGSGWGLSKNSINYVDGSSKATISIKNNILLNEEDACITNIVLKSAGYEKYSFKCNIDCSSELYNPPTVEIVQTDDGITIKSSDKNYLSKIANIYIYTNSRGYNLWKAYGDISYSNGVVNISNQTLNKRNVVNGDINISSIIADGYLTLYPNTTVTYDSGIRNECETSWSYDINKGLIISCDNIDYLNSLVAIEVDSYLILKKYFNIDTTNKRLIVSKINLLKCGVLDGEYYQYKLYSNSDIYPSYDYNYDYSNKLNIYGVNSISKVPCDVNIYYQNDLGLVFEIEDNDYLNSIININFGNYSYSNNIYDDNNFVVYDDKLLIKQEVLDSSIYEGTYYLFTLYSSCYSNLVDYSEVYIESCCSTAPTDIVVEKGNGSTLLVKSSNKDYLKRIYSSQLSINIKSNFNFGLELTGDSLYYDEINKYLVINYLSSNAYVYASGTIDMLTLNADYYENKAVDVNIPYNSGASLCTDEVEIEFDSNVGIILNSSNKDLLKSITKAEITAQASGYYKNNLVVKNCSYDSNNKYAYIGLSNLTNLCDDTYILLSVNPLSNKYYGYSYDTEYLLAELSQDDYDITYYLNGGTNNSANPNSFNDFENSFTLLDPSKEGYIFKGWYSDSNFTNKVTSIDKNTSNDIKLYAKWELDNELEEFVIVEDFVEFLDYNIVLNESITIDVNVKVDEAKLTDVVLHYTVGGNEFTVVPNKTQYTLEIDLSPLQLSEEIKIWASIGNDTSEIIETSLASYCEQVIEEYSDNSTVKLANAVKEYAEYSRYYFDNATDKQLLTTMSRKDFKGYKLSGSLGNENIFILNSASLVLDSNTSIKIYYSIGDNYNLDDFTISVNGVSNDNLVITDNYIEIKNIKSSDLMSNYVVNVYLGSNQIVCMNYNAMSYAYQVFSTASDQHINLKNLMIKMYEYAKAAIEYSQN